MIYLNNAEKTLGKPAAKDLSPVSADYVRGQLAEIFHIKNKENIYFGSSGTEMMEKALRIFLEPEAEQCHVIVTDAEQEDTYRLLKELGAEISVLKNTSCGSPDCEELAALIRPETRAIVCAHGGSAVGNTADLEQICAIARRYQLPVISDGRFTAGAIEVNLENSGVDAYCFSGEKMLMGPEGIGVLCVKERPDNSFSRKLSEQENLPQAERMTLFSAALEFIGNRSVYSVAMLTHRLAKRFFESASAMDGVTVHGDFSTRERLPIVAITAEGFSAEEIKDYMKERGIIIGTEKNMARFSFGYFNTRAQVKETVQCLMDMMGIDDPYLLP